MFDSKNAVAAEFDRLERSQAEAAKRVDSGWQKEAAVSLIRVLRDGSFLRVYSFGDDEWNWTVFCADYGGNQGANEEWYGFKNKSAAKRAAMCFWRSVVRGRTDP